MYLWENPEWPAFTWDDRSLAKPLAEVSRAEGRLLGKMEALGFDLRSEAHLRTLTEDVVESSEIEGETLARDQVRSSIARRLGMNVGGLVPADRNVEGVVEMMLDATGNYAAALTEERLFAWHAALFPTGRSGMSKIQVGSWRDDSSGPMQVVSGPIGREKVHYEAPPASRVPKEMAVFLSGLNSRKTSTRCSRRDSRICGLSPSTPSMTVTDGSHVRLRICHSPVRKKADSAFTACRRKSAVSATTITARWNGLRKVNSM